MKWVISVQMHGGLEPIQNQAEQPGVPSSFPPNSWVPPMPADFFTGPFGCLSLPSSEAMPGKVCSQGEASQPTATKPAIHDSAVVAPLDLGSLLGPVGDSWMGPVAAAPQAASLQPLPVAGTMAAAPHMVVAQKPFHMLFPMPS